MKELKKSKLAAIIGGTSTTILKEYGYSSENTTTENEYPNEESVGKLKPLIVQVPTEWEPLPDEKDVAMPYSN
ncbi:MAG: hypothetical protein R3Y59_09020 [bacterium]